MSKIRISIILLFFLSACTISACGKDTTPETFLSLIDAYIPSDQYRPVDNNLFAMPYDAGVPETILEGTLILEGESFSGMSFALVQDGRDLIPVNRGLIEEDITLWGMQWNYILEPGHIWQATRKDSLASLPVALVVKGENCVYNGVLAFAFDGKKVSRVWAQFTGETCMGKPIHSAFWLSADYNPGGIDQAEQVLSAFKEETANLFPVKPIEQLAVDYPGVDLTAFGKNIKNVSVYGVIFNGVNYVSGCPTRQGNYAYCQVMRMPSFSTAKSALAGMAFLRLGQKYGPEIANIRLMDTIPELTQDYTDWEQVTIENMLDLSSGHYGTEGTYDDPVVNRFFDGSSAAEISRAVLALPSLAPPGTRFYYRSGETFMALRAMQAYLRTQTGETTDLFDFMVTEVYQPLHIGPGFFSTMRTPDAERQALGALGLWWTVDDVAKITTFLLEGGQVDGEQILNPEMLKDSLFQNPEDLGLPQNDDPESHYNNGFWGLPYGPSTSRPDYTCEFWTTRFTGYGGIEFILIPNGMVYYYFGDAGSWYSDAAVQQADRIKSICP